jgi:hypothetical protein
MNMWTLMKTKAQEEEWFVIWDSDYWESVENDFTLGAWFSAGECRSWWASDELDGVMASLDVDDLEWQRKSWWG